jgi:peptidylprolyl isomerase
MDRQSASSALPIAIIVALALSGCGGSSARTGDGQPPPRTTIVAPARREPAVPLPQGGVPKKLVVKRLRPGWGVEAGKGDDLFTMFTAEFAETGKQLESTWEPGRSPFSFHLGREETNPGWEKGLRGMKVGERRELIVPPGMASRFATLPSRDTLAYVIELIAVRPPQLDGRHEPVPKIPPGAPPEHLAVRDLVKGEGPPVESGDLVTMRYVSRHYTGQPFSDSWDDGHPFRIHLGAGTYESIPGWEKGLPGMRVGGRREIIVPPDLIFQTGAPVNSKASETLVYLIDMFGTTEPGAFRGAPKIATR